MNEDIWRWLIAGLAALLGGFASWTSKRQVARIDSMELRLNAIDKTSISRDELDRNLQRMESKFEKMYEMLYNELRALNEKMERWVEHNNGR